MVKRRCWVGTRAAGLRLVPPVVQVSTDRGSHRAGEKRKKNEAIHSPNVKVVGPIFVGVEAELVRLVGLEHVILAAALCGRVPTLRGAVVRALRRTHGLARLPRPLHLHQVDLTARLVRVRWQRTGAHARFGRWSVGRQVGWLVGWLGEGAVRRAREARMDAHAHAHARAQRLTGQQRCGGLVASGAGMNQIAGQISAVL